MTIEETTMSKVIFRDVTFRDKGRAVMSFDAENNRILSYERVDIKLVIDILKNRLGMDNLTICETLDNYNRGDNHDKES